MSLSSLRSATIAPTFNYLSSRHLPKPCRRHAFVVKATIFSPQETLTNKPLPSSSSSSLLSSPAPLKLVSADSLKYESGYLGAIPECLSFEYDPATAVECLANVLTSKVYDVVVQSTLHLTEKLSERLGTNVWVKREDTQLVSDDFY